MDDQTEESVTAWQRTDPGAGLIGQTAGDESLDHASVIDDPEGGVLRADERADLVDDDLQHLIDGQDARDGACGGVNGLEKARGNPRRFDVGRG